MLEVENLKDWKKAGQISAQALEFGSSLIKKGASILEICDAVDKKMIELGGKPSFPSQISLDDVAAHFCPDSDDKIFLESQVVKLDVGASVNGCLGDNAMTVDLSGKNSELVKASRDALNAATKLALPGTKLNAIGAEIDKVIRSHGFVPIINLSGHGIGKFQVHTAPTIPNCDNGDEGVLEDNQIIAIEPFATNGAGEIFESSNATVFMEMHKRPVRSDGARQIMQEIAQYGGLPFTKRWLTSKIPAFKVNFALSQLIASGNVHAFPPLIEKKRGLVSQAEHTILVKDKPIILTSI